MKSERYLVVIVAVMASLASFLAGYLLTQPKSRTFSIPAGRQAILARFDGTLVPTPEPIGTLFPLANDEVLAPIADPDGDAVLYYHRDSGLVSRVALPSRARTTVSETILPDLAGIQWSPDGKKVIARYTSRAGTVFRHYDYAARQETKLPASVIAAAFSPDSKRIASLRTAGEGTDVVLSSADDTGAKTILRTRLADISLTWPRNHLLVLTVRGTGYTDLYFLTEQGDLSLVLERQSWLAGHWSPDGNQLLYSTTVNGKTALKTRNTETGTERTLAVSAPADRCVWHRDGAAIYCAESGPEGISIKLVPTSDLPSKTVAADLVIVPEEMFLSRLQDFLIILNRSDHRLYGIRLD